MAEYSPMMQHYLATKAEYKDCILFYRLGDFYEMFFDDALVVSKELELTLTGKDCGQEERAPMCGVPFHAAETYINRLVSNGHKVAICEQMEDPKQAKGIVKREVIKVVTPGTNLNSQALDETKNNYLMSIVYLGDVLGVAIADYSTGDFFVTEILTGFMNLDVRNQPDTAGFQIPGAERSRTFPSFLQLGRLIPYSGFRTISQQEVWCLKRSCHRIAMSPSCSAIR